MPEHPMLFDQASVRGLLDGTKTQTRRLVKPQPAPRSDLLGRSQTEIDAELELRPDGLAWKGFSTPFARCPHLVGTRIWVRETFRIWHTGEDTWMGAGETDLWEGPIPKPGDGNRGSFDVEYRADDASDWESPWRPSIFLPRRYARIVLEVVSVRVERVNAISEQDAEAEGFATTHPPGWQYQGAETARDWFRARWEGIHGPGAWDEALWVWIYGLRRAGE